MFLKSTRDDEDLVVEAGCSLLAVGELRIMARTPPPRGINAHYAIAAVAVTVLINRRKDIKLIPELLQKNGGQTRKVCVRMMMMNHEHLQRERY